MRLTSTITISSILLSLIIVFVIFVIIIGEKNKVKIVKCKSNDKKVTITFKSNKIYFVEGQYKMNKGFTEEQYNNIQANRELINYDSSNNTLNYSMYYNKDNEAALNFIGFNLNNSSKYKDVIKNLEDNNYYCK